MMDVFGIPFPAVFGAALIFGPMAAEARLSARQERRLRAAGAVEPPDDVWPVMAATYPAAFAAILIEGALRGGPSPPVFVAGMTVWAFAKILKALAIMALGDRWSFRVLVLPGEALVTRGPYRWMRHPNYLAVAGELIGAGIMMAAPYTGVVFTLVFIEIMRRRIRVEERALGLRRA
jgi:methyltransferase